MKPTNCCNTKRIVCILLYAIFLMSVVSSDFRNIRIPASVSESDRLALLDLKSRVVKDPLKIMSSWNDSSYLCNWFGVTCNSTTRRVVVLDLKARKLTGSIPPSVRNLTYLTEIRLGDNNFYGEIPQELGQLKQLHHLNLSHNNFVGVIPVNISHCTELVVLNLAVNRLVGKIPHQLCTLTKLELLELDTNNLIGTIPPWIGNLSSMNYLSFIENKLQGNIPNEVGRLSRLEFFAVYANYLTGTVPPSLYNISSLTHFFLAQNQLQGTIPQNIGFTLSNLQYFTGGDNNFSGTIPTSLTDASDLKFLDLASNSLIGMLPNDLGSLKSLKVLNFENNMLGSEKVGDLNFIISLANCTHLRFLGLLENRFGGALPPSIGNLSNELRELTLGENMLSGSIPIGIENLINLQVLGVENNYVYGSIPFNIGKLQNLVGLYLGGNKLTGPIPSSIGNLSSLIYLAMHDNKLKGSIPPSLGQCKSLLALYLSNNSLSGIIPKEVFNISSLSISLSLDHNSFNGPLTSEVGELVHLTELDVSNNKLSGDIPYNLGKCVTMERLNLGGNQFEGTIPKSLEALKGLESLDLSSNNLSGPISQFLGKFLSLKYLNLSNNNFEGKVPKEGVFSNSIMISINGNNNLCDGLPELHLPPCTPNQTHSSYQILAPKVVLIPVVSTITFIVILLSIIFVCSVLKKSRMNASTSSPANNFLPQISYFELSKSTGGFSMDNLIGSGSFGSVYKGFLLNDGSMVAIKVLNLQQQGSSKSFVDECHILSNIRHRNLLKIITSCSSIDAQGNEFKALVFHFMSNGNLDGWLHNTNHGHNQKRLSLIQRLNIAIDIASGLDYLYNHCETPIVHCDLKPSNVLLDNDMVAHVGDFGLARFMLEGPNQSSFGQTMSLALKGSIGYIPPEYGIGGRISIEGHIFSYGILLLEMIIGKRPTNDIFGNDVDIHMFAAMALSHGVLDIIDPSLLFDETHQQEEENEDNIQEIGMMGEEDRREIVPRWMEECLVSIIRIGVSCSSITPTERMSMNVVVDKLQAIRSTYLKFKRATRRFNRYLFHQA